MVELRADAQRNLGRVLEAAAVEETVSGRWHALTTTFPLSEAAAAHRALETRATIGKVVLIP
jgi:NADPH2:quinone reductase